MQQLKVHGGTMPILGFGTWPLTEAEAERSVGEALELGYRHIDTAQMYKNEAGVGRALKKAGLKRDAVFVTTKIEPTNYEPRTFKASLDESLKKLGLEQVDLLLLHWPNPKFPMEQTIELLLGAREAGKARHVGVSNLDTIDVKKAQQLAGGTLATNQVEFHPLLDQSELKKVCEDLGIPLTAYCPMARGAFLDDAALGAIGKRHGRSIGQVAIRWIVQQGVAAIPMSQKRGHMTDNLAALDFTLSEAEMAEIGRLTKRNHRVVDLNWFAPRSVARASAPTAPAPPRRRSGSAAA
jgi:2,5-diketo-D-gluconate reductase B